MVSSDGQRKDHNKVPQEDYEAADRDSVERAQRNNSMSLGAATSDDEAASTTRHPSICNSTSNGPRHE